MSFLHFATTLSDTPERYRSASGFHGQENEYTKSLRQISFSIIFFTFSAFEPAEDICLKDMSASSEVNIVLCVEGKADITSKDL